MSAGTLTLTNNSAAVAGSGTSFTTEVGTGDFIVVTVGGVPYTLPIKSVESGTALTLVSNFTGPTQSGAAWSAVPRVALNMVTAALVAQSAEALRGLNYDKQNWQQVFSNSGNITVKLPDGTTFTGPSWLSLSQSLSGKVNSDDSRLRTVNGKSGGTITSPVIVTGEIRTSVNATASDTAISAPGFISGFSGVLTPHNSTFRHRVDQTWGSYSYIQVTAGPEISYFRFTSSGSFTVNNALYNSNGDIAGAAWTVSGTTNLQAYLTKMYAPLSYRKLKENIELITEEDAIAEVRSWKTYNYDFIYGKKGSGIISDEVNPRFVSTLPYEFEGLEGVETVDQTSMLMGYVPPVLQFLLKKVATLENDISELKEKAGVKPADRTEAK
ncbi:tail fiber domain-containing protein [Enterobacter hormaechei subsp. steigerwaltii]|nr:tail fiber domain-containing protein [Enterobacter hormaechei subsp. steigerwaltii]MCU3638479.1 tail fiber domain-containing protein [Enterobacter hormaechei subsp. steigerwaltii]MCU3669525.1 tail fiber domain-containing protein [Enterobacter hormaechei subsp. steigerwaltii]